MYINKSLTERIMGELKKLGYPVIETNKGFGIYIDDDKYVEINIVDMVRVSCLGCKPFDEQKPIRDKLDQV